MKNKFKTGDIVQCIYRHEDIFEVVKIVEHPIVNEHNIYIKKLSPSYSWHSDKYYELVNKEKENEGLIQKAKNIMGIVKLTEEELDKSLDKAFERVELNIEDIQFPKTHRWYQQAAQKEKENEECEIFEYNKYGICSNNIEIVNLIKYIGPELTKELRKFEINKLGWYECEYGNKWNIIHISKYNCIGLNDELSWVFNDDGSCHLWDNMPPIGDLIKYIGP